MILAKIVGDQQLVLILDIMSHYKMLYSVILLLYKCSEIIMADNHRYTITHFKYV